MALPIVRAYARVYAFIKATLGLNLKGLGWMLRRIRRDQVIQLDGAKVFVDHRIATSYGLMIAGLPNETETIGLLRVVVDAQTTVVDVGANVGEFVLPIATQAKRVLAFEAHPIAAAALRQSVQLNGFRHVQVFEELVGDGGSYDFSVNAQNANASSMSPGTTVQSVRLDERLVSISGPVVIVIDVEGAEPIVLRGAAEAIARLKPLIVFEYNDVSRRSYDLKDVRNILGNDFDVFRLRRDGRLDDRCEQAWNCVAVPRDSQFEDRLKRAGLLG